MRRAILLTTLLSLGVLPGSPAATEQEPDPRRCSAAEPFQCLNGVSASVTSLDSLRISAPGAPRKGHEPSDEEQQPVKLAYAGDVLPVGLFAEEELAGFGVWGGGNYSGFESEIAVAPYDADSWGVLAGIDRRLSDRFTVGMAFGYEATDTNTVFNGGGQDTDGWTVAPYLSFLLSDNFSFDASAGLSRLQTDQDRIDPASVPGSAQILTSSFDSDRYFANATLNYLRVRGNWIFGARLGLLSSKETQDGYTETGGPSVRTVRERTVRLTQAWAGIDIGYAMQQWEPYVTAAYRHDWSSDDGSGAGGLPSAVGSTQPDDDDEGEVGLGIRYFGSNNVTGSFEWLRTVGREDFDNDTVSLLVRVDF